MIKLEVRVYIRNVAGPHKFVLEHDEAGSQGYIHSGDVVYEKFKNGVFVPLSDGTNIYYPHHTINCIEYNKVK